MSPVELVGFVPPNNEDVVLVNDDNLALTNLFVVHFEAGPLELFKVIESMLVQLREVEQLVPQRVRVIVALGISALTHLLQIGVFHLLLLNLLSQELDAIVFALVFGNSHKGALVASEDDGAARNLVLEYFVVVVNLRASLVHILAFEHDFCQQIFSHTVYLVELRDVSAMGACIRTRAEPDAFAVPADGFLALLALQRFLQDLVAHAADQLGQERFHLRLVRDVLFLVLEFLVLLQLRFRVRFVDLHDLVRKLIILNVVHSKPKPDQ